MKQHIIHSHNSCKHWPRGLEFSVFKPHFSILLCSIKWQQGNHMNHITSLCPLLFHVSNEWGQKDCEKSSTQSPPASSHPVTLHRLCQSLRMTAHNVVMATSVTAWQVSESSQWLCNSVFWRVTALLYPQCTLAWALTHTDTLTQTHTHTHTHRTVPHRM